MGVHQRCCARLGTLTAASEVWRMSSKCACEDGAADSVSRAIWCRVRNATAVWRGGRIIGASAEASGRCSSIQTSPLKLASCACHPHLFKQLLHLRQKDFCSAVASQLRRCSLISTFVIVPAPAEIPASNLVLLCLLLSTTSLTSAETTTHFYTTTSTSWYLKI